MLSVAICAVLGNGRLDPFAPLEIPWRMVIATRNQLIQGYVGINHDELWSIVQTDIPTLLASLRIWELRG